jgi:hypothetical protein
MMLTEHQARNHAANIAAAAKVLDGILDDVYDDPACGSLRRFLHAAINDLRQADNDMRNIVIPIVSNRPQG